MVHRPMLIKRAIVPALSEGLRNGNPFEDYRAGRSTRDHFFVIGLFGEIV